MKLLLATVCCLILPSFACAETAALTPSQVVGKLQETPVSRFEWGLERYRLALIEQFRNDPLSLELNQPPFFINVNYNHAKTEILVEIGRTFGTTEELRARQFCEDYLIHARSMLAIDKIGHPVVQGVSSLAKDFFLAPGSDEKAARDIGKALDSMVKLRGLVVAPASGIYSVCGAKLTGMPVKHLE